MCRASSSVVAVIVFLAALSAAAAGEVKITVDKNIQRMTVTVDGIERYSWPVSTGLEDYATPTGAFMPSRLARQHYSREWDNAPMPHSIFFTDAGHAIHGSNVIGRLGQPASHGCVRLAPKNAETALQARTRGRAGEHEDRHHRHRPHRNCARRRGRNAETLQPPDQLRSADDGNHGRRLGTERPSKRKPGRLRQSFAATDAGADGRHRRAVIDWRHQNRPSSSQANSISRVLAGDPDDQDSHVSFPH